MWVSYLTFGNPEEPLAFHGKYGYVLYPFCTRQILRRVWFVAGVPTQVKRGWEGQNHVSAKSLKENMLKDIQNYVWVWLSCTHDEGPSLRGCSDSQFGSSRN